MSKVIGGSTGQARPKVIPGGTGNSGSGTNQQGRPKVIPGGTGNSSSSTNQQGTRNSNSSNSSNNSDCFVATAAFGTPLQDEIQVLRDWRDRSLRYTSGGRKFITGYYKFGPIVANFIRRYPVLKAPVRYMIKGIIYFIK
ncbi:hypothetical protein EVJ20_08110 [Exiguobacterium sp. SH0S1]|uniref:CFI-box-CTERM domain-containing protein n=1 Tax=Exiguobacterium sp. SH0S1 TaxID=2510949 RepID=UPI00103923D7|nr:CFI-box-CTERM domain-containing protein [Exiguobacterium sp. SH0S1]TCI77912.1 hypothetical protein EVJ20_08110 [Exiguobacterium sp. SH0S1]